MDKQSKSQKVVCVGKRWGARNAKRGRVKEGSKEGEYGLCTSIQE
jgi:hypothetical protein